MGNRATPSRSFNTVKHSNREQRKQRKLLGRKIILLMLAVIALIALTGAIFLVCAIVDELNDRAPVDGNLPDDEDQQGDQSGTNDQIQYQNITQPKDAIQKGVLLLINEDHSYDPSQAPDLVKISENMTLYEGVHVFNLADGGYKLNSTALNALNAMASKFYEMEGLDPNKLIKIGGAYRTSEEQENYDTEVGKSDHHSGYCFALRHGNDICSDDHWIPQNAHKYGIIMRYPASKVTQTGVSGYTHCFRYVGIPHATYIYENGLCLEEYIELLQDQYADGTHLTVNGADGHQYAVYYVHATTDVVTVPVPKNYEYTLSGDNDGGFIVTVDLGSPVTNE